MPKSKCSDAITFRKISDSNPIITQSPLINRYEHHGLVISAEFSNGTYYYRFEREDKKNNILYNVNVHFIHHNTPNKKDWLINKINRGIIIPKNPIIQTQKLPNHPILGNIICTLVRSGWSVIIFYYHIRKYNSYRLDLLIWPTSIKYDNDKHIHLWGDHNNKVNAQYTDHSKTKIHSDFESFVDLDDLLQGLYNMWESHYS